MPGISRSTVFHALLSGATGPVSAGQALLYNAAGTRLVVATDANRTATGRVTAGICLSDADNDDVRVEVQFAGPIPPSVSGLTTGTATTVYVDANGDLARGVGSEDDVVGECDTDGTVYLLCGGLYGAGGSGGATPGGTTGSIQANNGSGGLTGYSTAKVGDGYISLGASPSSLTQGLNISYGYLNGVNSNNSSNSDQVSLICLRDGTGAYGLGTDLVQIGNGSYNLLVVAGLGRTTHFWSDDYKFNDGNGSEIASANSYGFQFGDTTPDFGAGQGVLGLKNAAVVPTTNPTDGIVLYAQSNDLKYRQPDGTIVTVGGGGGSSAGSATEIQTTDGSGGFDAATDVKAGSSFVSIGSGTVSTTGHIRFPAPTSGAGNERVLIAQRRSDGAGDLNVVSIYEGSSTESSAVFGAEGHQYTTVVGQTAFLASSQGTFGAGDGSYFGVRPDGLAFVNLAGGANKQIEFSSNIITDYAIELSPDVAGVVEWKTSEPVTNYRISFYRDSAPVRWLDASSALITLGYASTNVVPIRLDAKEVRQGNSSDNLRTTYVLDQVQTTDGTTWVDIASVDLSAFDDDESIHTFTLEVQGIENDGSSGCTLTKRRAIRVNGGTLTALVEGTIHSDVAELGGDARITTSGTSVKGQVQGDAATTIDWTGALIRAKSKASGAAPFDPSTDTSSTCRLWVRSDLGLTQSSSLVTAWEDQVNDDANKDFAASGSNRPGYTATNANYNNHPTIDFTANPMRLLSGTWASALSQAFTVFIVGKKTSGGASGYFLENLAATLNVRESDGGGLIANAGSNLADGTTNAPSVIWVEFNGGSSAIGKNQRSATVSGAAGATGATGFRLGNEVGDGGFLNGELAEVIVYDGTLSGGDKTAVLDYLEARYAITLAP